MTKYFDRADLIKIESDAEALLTSLENVAERAGDDRELITAGNVSKGHLLYLRMSKESHIKLQDRQTKQDANAVAFEARRLEEDQKEVIALAEGMNLDWKKKDDLDKFVRKLKPLSGSRMAEAIESLKAKARK